MSEEKMNHTECNCKHSSKGLVVLVIVSLLFSIASFVMSSMVYHNNAPQNKPAVSISKKYDKGQSIQKAMKTKKPMVLFFYVDWCGYCQRFAPTFNKIAKNKDIKKNFAVAYINCDDTKNSELLKEYQVQGFPTVFIVDNDGNKTHISNSLMFNDDSVEKLKELFIETIDKD